MFYLKTENKWPGPILRDPLFCTSGFFFLLLPAGDMDMVDCASKRRKKVSEAEKIALDLFKLTSRWARLFSQSRIKFEKNKIRFEDSTIGDSLKGMACCWTNEGHPIYCANAEFRFKTCLPEREYLTRYSVFCNHCRPAGVQAFHLYCSYCDEILKGSIAGPGGKIADHIITIRHIVKEASFQNQYFASKGRLPPDEYQQGVAYVAKLEQWASAIRFKRNFEDKVEFQQVLRSIQQHIQEAGANVYMVCAALKKAYSRVRI